MTFQSGVEMREHFHPALRLLGGLTLCAGGRGCNQTLLAKKQKISAFPFKKSGCV